MTKEEFQQLPRSVLATLCDQVIECSDAPEEIVKKARKLRTEILGSGDLSKEQQKVKRRVAAFLFDEQMFLKVRYPGTRKSDIEP
jgi:hypothetical protein